MTRDLVSLGGMFAVAFACLLPQHSHAQGAPSDASSASGRATTVEIVTNSGEDSPSGGDGGAMPESPADPMELFCAKLGKPVTRRAVTDFTGGSVERLVGGKAIFSEVIGNHADYRPRSHRYMADGSRSAHTLRFEGRRLCLELEGEKALDCALPLTCLSDEADYVLISEQGNPIARIHRDGRAPQNTAIGTEEEDWIRFAGGRFELKIDDSEPLSSQILSARGTRNDCRVGNGLPEIDTADMFFWTGSGCKGGLAKAPGTIVHMDKDGVLGHVDFKAYSGLSLKDGMIVWEFPTTPMDVRMVCEDSTHGIPKSANDVSDVHITVAHSPMVAAGEPAIHEKIIKDLLPYVERICGVPGVSPKVQVELQSHGKDAPKPLKLKLHRGVPQEPAAFAGDLVERERRRDMAFRQEAAREFRRYIVDTTRRDYERDLRAQIRSNGMISSLSNAIYTFKVPTLVALTKGRTFRMPWQHPTFEHGTFQVTWRVAVDNPLENYLARKPRGNLWSTIRQEISTKQSISPVRVTCRISDSAAQRFPDSNWVTVRGRLISYDGDRLVMDCSAG